MWSFNPPAPRDRPFPDQTKDSHRNQRGLSFTPRFPAPAAGAGVSGEAGPSFSNFSTTTICCPGRSPQQRANTSVGTALNGHLCCSRENYPKTPLRALGHRDRLQGVGAVGWHGHSEGPWGQINLKKSTAVFSENPHCARVWLWEKHFESDFCTLLRILVLFGLLFTRAWRDWTQGMALR